MNFRVNDHLYSFYHEERRHELKVSKTISPSKAYTLFEHARPKMEDNRRTFFVKLDGKLYKYHRVGQSNKLRHISHSIFKNRTPDLRYRVHRVGYFNFFEKLRGCCCSSIRKTMQKEVAAKDNTLNNSFDNAFTQIATNAFQIYNPNWTQKDDLATYAILSEDPGILKLTNIHKLNITDFAQEEACISALNEFKKQFIENFGEIRFEYLCHRYGIQYDSLKYLTPELVYRFNVGTAKCTYNDLRDLQDLLKDFNEELNESDEPLTQTSDLPRHYFKGLQRELGKLYNKPPEEVTVNDFKTWEALQNEISELDPDDFNRLFDILSLTPEELNLHYTGRKIEGMITGYYTVDDLTTYKPWVEDQELTQLKTVLSSDYYQNYAEVQKSMVWKAYMEKLSHVVTKKHLLSRDPRQEWRLGELIPAPGENGKRQWYHCTGMINNGTGIVTYTFESPTKSTLPAIKLCRSTASDPYAFDRKASILNNVNPLNSPGYESHLFTEEYEREFFESRSIPLWVAYVEEAQNAGEAEARDLCGKALDEMERFFTIQPKSFRQIIKDNDTAFLNLMHDKTLNEEAQNALEGIYKVVRDTQDSPAWIALHTLDKTPILLATLRNRENRTAKEEILLEELSEYSLIKPEQKEFVKEYQDFLLELDQDQPVFDTLNKIYTFAESMRETTAQKTHQSVYITGHSLGGAIAQKIFAKYTLLKGRIPISGQTFKLYEYDAPGINTEDNTEFLRIGQMHQDLLASRSPISEEGVEKPLMIHRTQAKADFIILGGACHLGAAADPTQIDKWLGFDAILAVRSRRYKKLSADKLGPVPAHAAQVYDLHANDGRVRTVPINLREQGIKRHRNHRIYLYTFKQYTSDVQYTVDGFHGTRRRRELLKRKWKMDNSFVRLKLWDAKTAAPRHWARKYWNSTVETEESPLYGNWREDRDEYMVFASKLNVENGKVIILSKKDSIFACD